MLSNATANVSGTRPQTLLSLLRADPGPHRVRHLRDRLGMLPHEFSLALKTLERRGLVLLKPAAAESLGGLIAHLYVELTIHGSGSASS